MKNQILPNRFLLYPAFFQVTVKINKWPYAPHSTLYRQQQQSRSMWRLLTVSDCCKLCDVQLNIKKEFWKITALYLLFKGCLYSRMEIALTVQNTNQSLSSSPEFSLIQTIFTTQSTATQKFLLHLCSYTFIITKFNCLVVSCDHHQQKEIVCVLSQVSRYGLELRMLPTTVIQLSYVSCVYKVTILKPQVK